MNKILLGAVLLAFSGQALSAVSAFSRSNCYVPIAEIGWESVTWGWPSSSRATSSWHLKNGDHPSKAINLIDRFRVTWRSFAGTSHGFGSGWNNTYTVRGKHWWAQTQPFNGIYNYKSSYAVDCNLGEW